MPYVMQLKSEMQARFTSVERILEYTQVWGLLRYECDIEGMRDVYRIVVGTLVLCLDISSISFSSKC